MTFYNQSLMAVKEGRKLLAELNVPTQRPNDYFCENVKTDTHMNRVSFDDSQLYYTVASKLTNFDVRPTFYTDSSYTLQSFFKQIKDRLLLEEKKMSAFDLRKQKETNRKFNKQVADLKLQEKNQQTKHQIAEVGKLAKGKGGSASVDKFLNSKPPSQKGPKRLAMVRKISIFFVHFFLS